MNRLARAIIELAAVALALPNIVACNPSATDTTTSGPAAQSAHARVVIAPDVVLVRANGIASVEVSAQVASRVGWLEQLVCRAGTREHESLLAVQASPRAIHAALLAGGFTPGSPGRWSEVQAPDGSIVVERVRPMGEAVELLVRFTRDGATSEVSLASWVRRVNSLAPAQPSENHDSDSLPNERFIFAGSVTRPNPPSLGPGEHYVADYTGSIVGLVTFGDEVIAFDEVIPDRVDVSAAEWEARTEAIPTEGTPVTLVIRRLAR